MVQALDLRRRGGVLIPEASNDAHPMTRSQVIAGYQPLDAVLTAFAALTITANVLVYGNGNDSLATTNLSSFGRSLIDDADASAARTTLGVVIGTDVQGYDLKLASIASSMPTDGGVLIGDGSGFVVESGATLLSSIGIGTTDNVQFADAEVNDLVINGTVTFTGTAQTISTSTIETGDGLIHLAVDNTSTDAVDLGVYATYTTSGTQKYAGWFRDASDGKFKLFQGLQSAPTTTVNTAGTGYAVATFVADIEGDVTGNINGVDPSALASRFITGAADEIDADQLDIDFTPSNYTPADVTGIAETAGNLSRHLKGIDTALASVGTPFDVNKNATSDWGSASGGEYTITIPASGAGSHGKGTNPSVFVSVRNGGVRTAAGAEFTIQVNESTGDVSISVPDSPDGRAAINIKITA